MSSRYVALTCEVCGDEYERHESTADDSRFCSNDCRHGKPLAAGETTPRDDPLWKKNRQRALERDNYTCQLCGGGEDEVSTLVVHHMRPLTHGGTHDLWNLDTLCRSCHAKIHAAGAVVMRDTGGALLFRKERDLLEQGLPVDLPREAVVEQVRTDVAILQEHHPELLQEIRDVVCEGEFD